jgi:hypothetical protein
MDANSLPLLLEAALGIPAVWFSECFYHLACFYLKAIKELKLSYTPHKSHDN